MRVLSLGVVSVVWLSCVAASARAQSPEDSARARGLFSEGVELAARADFEEAAVRFRAAYGIRQAPAIAFNLAGALVELDQLLEASELVRTAQASQEADWDLRARAAELREKIDARLARLTVTVDGGPGDATIVVDGRTLSVVELGVPILADPGPHEVRAERAGALLERREVTLDRGGSEVVTLASGAWPTAQVVAGPEHLEPEHLEPALPEEPIEEPGVHETWWFWTIVGAVLVTGTAVTVVAASGDADPYMGDTNPGVLVF